MHELAVQIVRFVDDGYPGWVEFDLVDAEGRHHLFIEKVPVITLRNLDADSEYPIPETVLCDVLKRYQDDKGRELVQVSTAKPWSLESTEGLTEFTVPAFLVTPEPG